MPITMETQSPTISSTTLDDGSTPPETSPAPDDQERPRSPSMMDGYFQDGQVWRAPSPEPLEMIVNPPNEMQGGDFVFHEAENLVYHVNYPPPAQLNVPFPVFRSVYRSGSCPFWASEETRTSAHVLPRCEDCGGNSIILRQNNLNEIQLHVSEFRAIYETIENLFQNRR